MGTVALGHGPNAEVIQEFHFDTSCAVCRQSSQLRQEMLFQFPKLLADSEHCLPKAEEGVFSLTEGEAQT